MTTITMLNEGADFIKNCKPKKTAVVYHRGCGDGISAAAVLIKTFERHFNERPAKIIYANPGRLDIVRIPSYYEYIIFVDLAADQNVKELSQWSENAKIAIFDHHKINQDMNKHGILHVHPDIFQKKIESSRYCGAKLTYDICSLVADISDFDWIAGVGIINDVGGSAWKKFLDGIYSKYPELNQSKKKYDFSSQLGEIASLFSAGKDRAGGERLALEVAIGAESPKDLIDCTGKAALLGKYKKQRETEISSYTTDWKSKAEVYNNLVIYEIHPKYEIVSPISTIISMQEKKKTVVILRVDGDYVKVSYRNQTATIDCNKLAMQLSELFGGTGGGHPQAAGGIIPVKNLDAFRKKLIDSLGK